MEATQKFVYNEVELVTLPGSGHRRASRGGPSAGWVRRALRRGAAHGGPGRDGCAHRLHGAGQMRAFPCCWHQHQHSRSRVCLPCAIDRAGVLCWLGVCGLRYSYSRTVCIRAFSWPGRCFCARWATSPPVPTWCSTRATRTRGMSPGSSQILPLLACLLSELAMRLGVSNSR